MKIRTKLLIYMIFTTLFIIPLYLWMLYVLFYLDDSKKLPDNKTNGQARVIRSLLDLSRNDPDALLDNDYLGGLKEELADNRLIVMVYKDQSLSFQSAFPGFGAEHANRLVSLQVVPVMFAGHIQGTLCLFSEFDHFQVYLMKRLPYVITTYVGVVIGANAVIAFLVSRSVNRHFSNLLPAINKLKEGDLDTPVRLDRKDEFGQIAVTLEDMRTRLKESIEKQIEYENARKWTMADLTHDIKTPLMIAKGYVKGIQDGVANTEEKRTAYLDIVYGKIELFEEMVDRVLLFSKLNLNQIPFLIERVGILQLLQEAGQKLNSHISFNGIDFSIHNEVPPDTMVLADIKQVGNLIMNIYENTIKYADKTPIRMTITTRETEQHVTTFIKDNGPGIHPDDLPHIFNRFYRAEAEIVQSKQGSGLGLAIAYQTITSLGGEIGADSIVGEGLTIWFSLKKAPAPATDSVQDGFTCSAL